MVTRIALFLFVLFATVLSAPAALDRDTLLKNAQTAQALNALFQNLSRTDTCNDGESACINGQRAICADSAWELTQCPGSRKCFALPSIRLPGTFLGCTSEANALSIIEGAGGKGGIVSTDGLNSSVPLPIVNPTDSPSPPIPTPTDLVTITITLGGPFDIATLPPVVSTLSPEEAYSQFMSLLSAGGSLVRTSSMPEPTLPPLPSSTFMTIPSSAPPLTALPSFTSTSIPNVPTEPTSSYDDY